MELNQLDAGLIFLAHHLKGQSPCTERLTNTRCTLQDDVLLVLQKILKPGKVVFGHEHFVEEILPAVFLIRNLMACTLIRLADEIHNDAILLLRQLEEAAIRISKELHLLEVCILLNGCVWDRSHERLHFLKPDPLAIIFFRDNSQSSYLLCGISLIANHFVSSLGICKVVEDTSLVAVVVVESVILLFPDGPVRHAPDGGIGTEPEIITLLFRHFSSGNKDGKAFDII